MRNIFEGEMNMKTAVRFYSKSGNTEKLAKVIAQAVNCTAKKIYEPMTESVDVLFLGGALYAGNLDKELQKFVTSLTADKVKKIVIFSTAAGPKSIQPLVKSLLEGTNISVSDEFFQCRGKFLLANKNRPNEDDLNNAKAFAKKILKS